MTSREKICVISSDDKDLSSISNSNFFVNLKEKYATQSVDRITVMETIVPNAFYNISDGSTTKGNGPENNKLILSATGMGTLNFVLPAGQYNILQLMASLQTLINAQLTPLGRTVTITRDEITNLLTFSFLGGVPILFKKESTMAPVLGFATDLNGTLVTMTEPPDLSGINSVYIHSEALSDGSGIDASKGIINLVDCVSLHNVPYGTFSYKQTTDASFSTIAYTVPRNLNRIDIRLRDREGNLLNIGTKRLTLVIKVYYSV